ncbi:MAG: hypothetical protein ACTSW4_04120 [Candidatus Ranarchaeia archaeon]
MSQISLNDVYMEVKRVNTRLESIERILEDMIEKMLPEEELTEEEWKEIDETEKEVQKGERLTIEAIKKKYGVP